MKLSFTLLGKIILSVALTTLTFLFCFYIAEKYFFDKVFYQKSALYGYYECSGKTCDIKRLGKRSKDITKLLNPNNEDGDPLNNVLGLHDSNTFNIAILGDSIVLGVGVKQSDQFQTILEKKLSKIKPVKVYSLGFSGDSTLDNLSKYELFRKNNSADLFIFVLVENDLLFTKGSKYESEKYDNIISKCNRSENPIVYVDNNRDYLEQVFDSLTNESNLCVVKASLSYFPTNAIYFSTELRRENRPLINNYLDIFADGGFNVIFAEEAKTINGFNNPTYWNNADKYFHVSQSERHPSKLVHRMYAEILYKEITSNHRWGFISGQ